VTSKHSKNAVAAKERRRMERLAPDYPAPADYSAPVESWTFRNYRTGQTHKLVLFHSRRRCNAFRVTVNGKEWTRAMGYDRIMRQTVKSLSK
jgi:hypothetical protein